MRRLNHIGAACILLVAFLAVVSAVGIQEKVAKSFLLKGSDMKDSKRNILLELNEFDPLIVQHYTALTPRIPHHKDDLRTEAQIMKRAEEISGLRHGPEYTIHSSSSKEAEVEELPRFVSLEAKKHRFREMQKKEEEKKEHAEKERIQYEKHVLPRISRTEGQMYEDCMGCRLIWKQVEMDVANARYIEDVQNSFEHNAVDAQKSEIFYKVAEDMYDDGYKMIDDYMSGKFTADQMCLRAHLCAPVPKQ